MRPPTIKTYFQTISVGGEGSINLGGILMGLLLLPFYLIGRLIINVFTIRITK